jgi:hypothetical protein
VFTASSFGPSLTLRVSIGDIPLAYASGFDEAKVRNMPVGPSEGVGDGRLKNFRLTPLGHDLGFLWRAKTVRVTTVFASAELFDMFITGALSRRAPEHTEN